MAKVRVDQELVDQGFFATVDDAKRAIMAGIVSTQSNRVSSPGQKIEPGSYLHVKNQKPYVSRGGLKLAGGLDAFGLDVEGLECLDVGCSSGGFTDCLLRRGAKSVVAVDVGYAQFDWTLRNDKRVMLLERTNICDVPDLSVPTPFDLAVCDVSFTSICTIAPSVSYLLKPGGIFVTLVKPQFEAERDEVDEGGIVRDPAVRLKCLMNVAQTLEELSFEVIGACTSPIHGAKGNIEYMLMSRLRLYYPEDEIVDEEEEYLDSYPLHQECLDRALSEIVYENKTFMR